MRRDVRSTIAALDQWAASLRRRHVHRAYVFGSLVHDEGAEFLPRTSDVDLVVVLAEPSSYSVAGRVRALRYLRGKVRVLDGTLRSVLGRSSSSPIVSVVAVTPFEVVLDVHKGKEPKFFRENRFVELGRGMDSPAPLLVTPLTTQEGSAAILAAAMADAQGFRNRFLSVNADGEPKLKPWGSGIDAAPKALARRFAQLRSYVLGDREGQFDVNKGAQFLLDRDEIWANVDEIAPGLRARLLRRMNRGRADRLSALQHLVLWEMVYQEAQNRSWDTYRLKRFAHALLNLAETAREAVPEIFAESPGEAIAKIRALFLELERRKGKRISEAEMWALTHSFLAIEHGKQGAIHRYYLQIRERDRRSYSPRQNRILDSVANMLADQLVSQYAMRLGIRVRPSRDSLDEITHRLNVLEFYRDRDRRPIVRERDAVVPGPLECDVELGDWVRPHRAAGLSAADDQ